MTTPGSGDQPQNPGQGWGQQPPSGSSGPDQPGQTPQSGQQWAAPGGQPQQPGQAPSDQQYGQPQQPGQPQQFGQPGQPQQPGQFGQPGQPGQQPGQPGQPWAGQQFSGEAPKKERPAWQKRLPLVIGAVVVALVVAAFRGGLFGGGAPEVGDCVKADGASYDVVDCDSSDAQYRIFGTDSDMTESAFTMDLSGEICLEAATQSNVTDGVSLWYGTSGDDGKVFCAETL